MTLAIQPDPAAALRASLDLHLAQQPAYRPLKTALDRVPRFPALVGTVMTSATPVTVMVADGSPGAAPQALLSQA